MSSAHSPNFSSLYFRHSSFCNPSVALPTSKLILQPFRCFTYVTVHSPTLLSLLLRHKLFTFFTWRAAHECRPNALSAIGQFHRNISRAGNISYIHIYFFKSWRQNALAHPGNLWRLEYKNSQGVSCSTRIPNSVYTWRT